MRVGDVVARRATADDLPREPGTPRPYRIEPFDQDLVSHAVHGSRPAFGGAIRTNLATGVPFSSPTSITTCSFD